jgi:hypothetical protein
MEKGMSFDEFWQEVDPSSHKDGPAYHSCCDLWSKRGWRRLNNNHTKTLQWRKVALLLDKSVENKKLALLAKMTEEGWKTDVTLNKHCQDQPRKTLHSQSAFKLHGKLLQPQNLQPSFAPQDFDCPSPDYLFQQAPGMLSLISSPITYKSYFSNAYPPNSNSVSWKTFPQTRPYSRPKLRR